MAAFTVHSAFGAQENKVCPWFHCFPIYLPWSDWTGCGDLSFWMLSFKPAFSVSSFTFINRPFNLSWLSTIMVVSSAYLKLLLFLLTVLIPACDSSRVASAYKLNKQDDNIQSWCTPFPIWNQSVVPCPVLTVASWPAYRFHRRQVRNTTLCFSLNNISHLIENSLMVGIMPHFSPYYHLCHCQLGAVSPGQTASQRKGTLWLFFVCCLRFPLFFEFIALGLLRKDFPLVHFN